MPKTRKLSRRRAGGCLGGRDHPVPELGHDLLGSAEAHGFRPSTL
ncbi:hypothetical protein [Streptomyces violascens]